MPRTRRVAGECRYRSCSDTWGTFRWRGDDLGSLARGGRGRGRRRKREWKMGACRRTLRTAGFVSPRAQQGCAHLS